MDDTSRIIDPLEEERKKRLEEATKEELVAELENARREINILRRNEQVLQDTVIRLAMKLVGNL